jgi:hypothetical protein
MTTVLTLFDRNRTLSIETRSIVFALGERSGTLHLGAAMTDRQVQERDISQGIEEEVVYSFSTTPWGSSPTSITAKVFDVTNEDRTDVTATVMPTGAASAVGDVISLPALKLLTDLHIYRVEVKFTAGGNVLEPFFFVRAEQ